MSLDEAKMTSLKDKLYGDNSTEEVVEQKEEKKTKGRKLKAKKDEDD